MLRSFFSGISGMKNNQVKMDVISNNISNVNTTAFKTGMVRFQDVFSQTLNDATAPSAGRGGINPRQVGLGMQLGGIYTLMTQGAPQATGRPLDFAIDGEGFFVLSKNGTIDDGTGVYTSTSDVYSRDGAFNFDAGREVGADGQVYYDIVSADGYRVMGYINAGHQTTDLAEPDEEDYASATLESIYIPELNPRDTTDPGKLISYSIEANGTVKAIYEGDNYPVIIGKIAIAKFSNPAGLAKLGGNNYLNTSNSGAPSVGMASEDGRGDVLQSYLEMSNVDLASEFTDMIITSRAYQANSRSITTSDEMLQELLNLKR
ncbi:flagellar basal-body rod protein FlgG [Oxobacter pfennigii]|uniref:Flagellar hook protein FlgE n=1 Tax=Oxobacter pfennigii TaxID=36849 RepID=A0A0P9AGX7_9CLOT|nr:flagellar hook-basal body complex protein [Oxobacter pfennigii]KPU44695.1 flagellar basal-body rod protein FlgG [Oxobacter pfennigii]